MDIQKIWIKYQNAIDILKREKTKNWYWNIGELYD